MDQQKNPSLAALLTFLLGPIGLLIMGMGVEAAVYFGIAVGISLLLVAAIVITAKSVIVGVLLILILVPVSIAFPPLYGYYAAKRRNGEPIPFFHPRAKRAAVEAQEVATEAVAGYMATYGEQFAAIGYQYADFGAAVEDANISTKVCLGRDSLGRRVEATITNIACGKTDDRAYLTYAVTDAREGILKPTAQVEGIYVGPLFPRFVIEANQTAIGIDFTDRYTFAAAQPDTQARILTPELKALLMSKPVGAGAIWSEGGWLLTDSYVNVPEIVVATAGWEYLTACLDALPETLVHYSADFGEGKTADSLVRSIVIPGSAQLPF